MRARFNSERHFRFQVEVVSAGYRVGHGSCDGAGHNRAPDNSMIFAGSIKRALWRVFLLLLLPGAFLPETGSAASLPPSITVQPANQTVVVQGTVAFQVTVSSLTTVFYQWRKNGTNIFGATSSNYVIVAVQPTH